MINGPIQKEDITVENIYASNVGAPQYIRQTLTSIKGEINSNISIVGDFNTPLNQWTDHQNRESINTTLTEILDQMDLIDIFRTFHPNAEE